jgi:plastocyanin
MKITARFAAALAALCLAAALVGPPAAGAAPPEQSGASAADAKSAYHVDIRNFAFTPQQLTVPAGSRIVWTNRDDEPHVVVSTNGAFKASPALDTNDSFAVVLDKPGTYAYFCGIHPMMVGKIVVR